MRRSIRSSVSACLALLALLPLAVAQTPGAAEGARVFVRVNQVGYLTSGAKVAVAFAREPLPEGFTVVDAATGKTVFEGAARQVHGSWGEFAHHAELDFSPLKRPGRFFVRVGPAQSQPFAVGPGAYSGLPDQLLEFMRQQRCGYNPWLDAVCHPFDGRTAYGPLPAGTYLDATGGWHDAGDQLKYLLTSSNATAQMLLAYVLGEEEGRRAGKPGRAFFRDDFNELGQPGANGTADILDEARWGLDWMLRLHPGPSQLYHQVADDRDHAGWRLPQKDTVDYGWGPGLYRVVYFADGRPQGLRQYKSASDGVANLAGRYAAAMALGYQVWKGDPRQRAYAERLLRAGREAYELGRADEGVQQGNSYGAPYRYEETTWADDMEWGAAELLRATGERRYLEDAKRYALRAASESWMGREQAGHYQFYPFINVGHFRLHGLVDKNFQRALAGYYREGIEACARAGRGNPYEVGVPFIWCSNNLTVALATQCLLYERMTGDGRFGGFASKQRDWLLGRNPWGFSMFTEIPEGGAYPKDVHLFANTLLKKGVRGGLVDGPVYARIFRSLKGVSVTEPDPLAPFQDERAVYHDDVKDYSTNEPTMDGTASAILLWALLAGETAR
ncbi:MAG TPA: glycoside hydrolase family 9 protein [Pyrinomonadaceae bacterium]|nr:glycoside hydrolase family 9 protein [Pyrinomonadaceae bacterium]